MNREQLRKVEYKLNNEIKIGWFHTWEQLIWNTRYGGGIEDVEAQVYALVEDELGNILEITHRDIKFV